MKEMKHRPPFLHIERAHVTHRAVYLGVKHLEAQAGKRGGAMTTDAPMLTDRGTDTTARAVRGKKRRR